MSAPTKDEIARIADRSLERLPNVFEVALVLGGTVSAGAYTAGVLDFLVQAMDCWAAAQAAGRPDVPQHKVALRVVSGTSGGGVNAAILARALGYEFPHLAPGTPAAARAGTGNPFYDTWITEIRDPDGHIGLSGLLGTRDLGASVDSLLNGMPIDSAARYAASFRRGEPIRRPWVGRPVRAGGTELDPLHVILTLTNLRGVPYITDLGEERTETFVNHADHARFAVCYPGMVPTQQTVRPDEWTLGFAQPLSQRATSWDEFSLFARATSAFPVGLPARSLVRPSSDYHYRVAVLPGTNGQPEIVPLVPDWSQMGGQPGEPYAFACVDGGATDNEPLQLARTAMSGVSGRNPRSGTDAFRAVILVDPFAGKAPLGANRAQPVLPLLGGLSTAIVQQTRYDSSDLILAAKPDVYSRFMVTAVREHSRDGRVLVGGDAIASSGLDAFIGFACADFMRHDFLLGRRNCQQFLRRHFTLPEDATVFDGMWDGVDRDAYRVADDTGSQLPLIPLVGTAAVDDASLGPNPWPVGKLDPGMFRDAIRGRVGRIAAIEAETGAAGLLKGWIAKGLVSGPASDYAVGMMRSALMNAADPLLAPT